VDLLNFLQKFREFLGARAGPVTVNVTGATPDDLSGPTGVRDWMVQHPLTHHDYRVLIFACIFIFVLNCFAYSILGGVWQFGYFAAWRVKLNGYAIGAHGFDFMITKHVLVLAYTVQAICYIALRGAA